MYRRFNIAQTVILTRHSTNRHPLRIQENKLLTFKTYLKGVEVNTSGLSLPFLNHAAVLIESDQNERANFLQTTVESY